MSMRSETAEPKERTDGPSGPSSFPDLKAMDDGIALLSRYWQQLADMETTLETAEFTSSASPPSPSTVDVGLD